MKLRPYQQELAQTISKKLSEYGICYFAGEVRIGKTLTALTVGLNYKNVLFVTKKKAISSIEEDYEKIGYSYKLTVINYESLHKLPNENYDLVIADESHTCFLEGTLIDGKEIQNIKKNDIIRTYNETTNQIEYKKVVKTIKKKNNKVLVKINAGGKQIICTADHLIYTNSGYKKAITITKYDKVFMV